MICLCNSERCRGRGERTESGDLRCPTTEAIEAAAVAGVRAANPEATIPDVFGCDGATVVRALMDLGLEIRPIRKPRAVRS